jgi:2,3-dihydroxybenzoate decarboxylase
MLNGFTNIGDAATGWYYDHERFWPFWERAEALGVPVYLHPRDPLPGNRGIYEGHPELFAPYGPSPSRPPPTRCA